MTTSIFQISTPLQDQLDFQNFGTVFFYCALIIIFPILAFFTSKTFLFDGYWHMEAVKSNIFSAVTAVIALHIALGMYIYRAYNTSKAQRELDAKLE